MLKKEIRKSLVEIKEQKEKRVIQEQIVKNRVAIVLEGVKNEKDFKKLSKEKQFRISVNLVNELSYLQNTGLLVEQDLMDSLKSLFGPAAFSGFAQTLFEPILNGILSGLGFGDGFFKNFLISALTSQPSELIHAFKDCKTMTKLLVRSFIEAEVMLLQKEAGLGGYALDFVRNGLGSLSKNVEFISHLEDSFSGSVCELMNKVGEKAENVVSRVKNNAVNNTKELVNNVKGAVNRATS